MQIAVVGSGAIGLYFGSKLAVAGEEVSFLMRSGINEAREHGIRIFEEDGSSWGIPDPRIAATTEEIGPVDVILIALKSTSNALLPATLPPLLKENTLLLTLQNGIGIEEDLAAGFPGKQIAGGLCFICLSRVTAASVRHVNLGSITLGAFTADAAPTLFRLKDAWIRAGVSVTVHQNLTEARWRKLMWNIPFNGLGITAGGVGVDKILKEPELRRECEALVEEVRTTAIALGFPIEREFALEQIRRTYPMRDYHPSTVLDYIAGRALEIDAIWGRPLRIAAEAGIAMPCLEELHEELLALSESIQTTEN